MTPEQKFNLVMKLSGIIRDNGIEQIKANIVTAAIIDRLDELCLVYLEKPQQKKTLHKYDDWGNLIEEASYL